MTMQTKDCGCAPDLVCCLWQTCLRAARHREAQRDLLARTLAFIGSAREGVTVPLVDGESKDRKP